MGDAEVRKIHRRYGPALAKLEALTSIHQTLGLEHASPDLIEAAREVQELNARAREWVDPA